MNQNAFQIIYWIVSIVVICTTLWLGPMNAVKVGRRLNNEQQKDNAKRNLFLTLFALRGSPVNYDFVRGLNQIDIVFEDCQPVLDSWHTYLTALGIKDTENTWDLLRTNLLSAMAIHLGYTRTRQTDMLQHYYPAGHDNMIKEDLDHKQASLTYLKSGTAFHEFVIEQLSKPPEPPTDSTKQ